MSNDVEQIKDKLDVVDIISEYVQMKPAGINHKGLCPFHNEKSPSFMASRERQSWHCFGCNKGGDIFTFVQEMEGMEFKEALKYLAQKAGIVLTNTFQNEVQSSQKNRIKDINIQAASFFHNFLLKMVASQDARAYLHDRGLSDDTIVAWRIGFVPEQWDLLTQYLLKKGFAIDDLVASGLTIKRDNADSMSHRGFYDRFRGRIMFPIWDIHDHVVGFTGRVLVEHEKSGGKYVNTPQTAVYDKSRVVFGLNKAKQAIRQQDVIVMVEGQMDVIACHQAGMHTVVATSGTALTSEQIKLLSRYSKNLNLCFDVDSAGLEAADKHFRVALNSGMHVVLTKIPEDLGKDADECIKNDKENFFKAVENAEDVMSWLMYKIMVGRDINNLRDKNNAIDEYLSTILLLPHALYKDHWLQVLSDKMSVDKQVLRERMSEIEKNNMKKNTQINKKEEIKENYNLLQLSTFDQLIERCIILLFMQKNPTHPIVFPLESLSTGPYKDLYEMLKTMYTTQGKIDIISLRNNFVQSEEESIVDILLMKGEKDFATYSSEQLQEELEQISKRIQKEWNHTERSRITTAMIDAEKDGDTVRVTALMQELIGLSNT